MKYPRTYHLPWSPGRTNDDRVMKSICEFQTCEIVVTVKMDGENTSMHHDKIHARSLDYAPHPSRNWVKALHAQIAHQIYPGVQIVGENLFAKHSIHYQNLEDYFLVFGVWMNNAVMPWDFTTTLAGALGLKMVPVLYRGPFISQKHLEALVCDTYDNDPCEGYVVRITNGFADKDMKHFMGKYVRANHVQTDEHWLHQPMVRNGLKKDRVIVHNDEKDEPAE